MSETSEKILGLLSKALPRMSEAEKEKLLWFSEGMAAAVRTAQDSALKAAGRAQAELLAADADLTAGQGAARRGTISQGREGARDAGEDRSVRG